eukprot:IDg11578t1
MPARTFQLGDTLKRSPTLKLRVSQCGSPKYPADYCCKSILNPLDPLLCSTSSLLSRNEFPAYVAEHPSNFHEFISPLAYAHNTQVHTNTGQAPLEIVFSRLTGLMMLKKDFQEANPIHPIDSNKCFGLQIDELVCNTKETLAKNQESLKPNIYSGIRTLLRVHKGYKVYLHREWLGKIENSCVKRRHK